MPVLRTWSLQLDADQVLRGQGADAAIIRSRSPQLVTFAERAVRLGAPLLRPAVLYRRLAVKGTVHERIQLEDGNELRGSLIGQHLMPAVEVVVIICTIGPDLEEEVARAFLINSPYGLALDGLGSAAVEALANAACHRFEMEARESGLETSIPLSPGMRGWPLQEGLSQVLNILQADQVGVSVTPSWVMLPKKSLSMVLGMGYDMMGGTSCQFCALHDTCRYQDHYAPAQRA
jgi:hypothetical protein